MESLTLFLSNTINMESQGFSAHRDLFRFIWTPIVIFAFFKINFTQYKLMIHPPSCQLTIEFIALLRWSSTPFLSTILIFQKMIIFFVKRKYNASWAFQESLGVTTLPEVL